MSQVLITASRALAQQEAEKTERKQAEAEATARAMRVKIQEPQHRFRCHIEGCQRPSAGPRLEEDLR